MEKVLDKEQVLAQLEAKSEEISRRLDAIQSEVATTGQALRDAIFSNPLVSVGGSITAGLLVGLLFGGSKKERGGRKKKGAEQRVKILVDEYVNAVAEEVRKTSRKGVSTEDAVRHALRDRVPVIFYEAPREEQGKQGVLSEAFELAYKTALGFAVKVGIDFVTARLHLDSLTGKLQASEGVDAAAPVAAVVSESGD